MAKRRTKKQEQNDEIILNKVESSPEILQNEEQSITVKTEVPMGDNNIDDADLSFDNNNSNELLSVTENGTNELLSYTNDSINELFSVNITHLNLKTGDVEGFIRDAIDYYINRDLDIKNEKYEIVLQKSKDFEKSLFKYNYIPKRIALDFIKSLRF